MNHGVTTKSEDFLLAVRKIFLRDTEGALEVSGVSYRTTEQGTQVFLMSLVRKGDLWAANLFGVDADPAWAKKADPGEVAATMPYQFVSAERAVKALHEMEEECHTEAEKDFIWRSVAAINAAVPKIPEHPAC